MTQKQASTALGRPQSFIAKCEAGERRLDYLELKALAGLYGKDVAYFDPDVDVTESPHIP